MPQSAYIPSDPTQQAFLSALALGESSGPGAYTQGVGGTNLAGATTDGFGFPQWGGFGNSHAAGAFQFQPATFDAYATKYGLNFGKPADQNAAAWYLAQDTYTAKTGGNLSDALAAKDYGSVQSALSAVWPSVGGNGASPGLAQALAGGQGAPVAGGNPISADTSPLSQFLNMINPVAGVANDFVRIALVVVGVAILIIALWHLLANTGAVPSPGQVARSAGKVALAAV